MKLAGLNMPLHSHLEILAALCWVLLPTVVSPIVWVIAGVLACNTSWAKYIILTYFLWMYVDRKSSETGGRRSKWFRGLRWWHYLRDYFPVQLVKTSELPSDQNYLFASYPHGVFSAGVFSSFATDAHDFESLFPGLKLYFGTLNIFFRIPIMREFALGFGMTRVSEKSLKWILGSKERGRVAVIVVGGAAEALYSHPGQYKIILKPRKGFCRVALETGSNIVPTFSFGETDLYEQVPPNVFLVTFQKWVKKLTGIAPVIFVGRGIFDVSFGIIPRRAPVTVVVGNPISVSKVKNPTREQVDELHARFTQALIDMFNEGKTKYLKDPTTELTIC